MSNSFSVSMFESFRSNLLTMHIMSPSLFVKTTWKQMSEFTAREAMVDEHERHLGKFEWNEDAQLKVSLMVQGTTSEAAWGISQSGFGVIASEKDQGWFGKGIYLTSSLKYANLYAKRSAKLTTAATSTTGDVQKKAAVLVCAVISGNILPVVDAKTYYGKHVANGYQSHFTVGSRLLLALLCIISDPFSFFLE